MLHLLNALMLLVVLVFNVYTSNKVVVEAGKFIVTKLYIAYVPFAKCVTAFILLVFNSKIVIS